jgi:hypothetical protein
MQGTARLPIGASGNITTFSRFMILRLGFHEALKEGRSWRHSPALGPLPLYGGLVFPVGAACNDL